MNYAQVSQFAQTWGLVLLALLFACAVAYALWPGNREKFKRAASTPLEKDNDDGRPD
jgi:cytochrome c oxidase cbb3-type subunit 4